MDLPEPHPAVVWELTRECDLDCRGCIHAPAERRRHREDLPDPFEIVDQVASLEPREFVITGGDPLEREDLDRIIDHARGRGLDPILALSPTSRLTFDAISRLPRSGLTRGVFSIDGATRESHAAVHGLARTFPATMRAMRWAECVGLKIEVNTLVCRGNANELAAIAELIRPFRIARWNLHFLVPVGESREIAMLTAEEVEELFPAIDRLRARRLFPIRVVEAPHYRRYLLQRNLHDWLRGHYADRELAGAVREGARAFVYISHAGDVRPSEFVPQSAGSLRHRALNAIYRDSELFSALREPDNLQGKCRHCDFRHVCGGSRARAWAMTGDLFGTDPLCAYEAVPSPREVGRGPG